MTVTTCTTLTLSKSDIGQTPSSPETTPVNEATDSCTLPFNNPEIAKESFLAKIAVKFLDSSYSIFSKFNENPLPKLEEKQLITIIEMLAEKRILKGRDDSFEVTFTIAELFNFLLEKGGISNIFIENIEFVGSGLPWILNEYVNSVFYQLGFENLKDLLPQELMEAFAKKPKDFDFRISVPNASLAEIQYLKGQILGFFIEKKVKEIPSLDKTAFCRQLTQHGFTVLTGPKRINKSLLSTVGVMDACSGCRVDVVIKDRLEREHLFGQDNLRLVIQQLILALKTHSSKELVDKIKAKTFDPIIIPCSDFGNGTQAIVERLAGIVKAVDIPSINCAGWGTLLICYLKGERCLTLDLEKLLLDKLCRSFETLPNEVDVPLALYEQLIELPNPTVQKKMAITTAYWLKKALHSHLGENQEAALILTLQACASLKLYGYEESVDDLWFFMKDCTDVKDKGICGLLNRVMNSGPGAFNQLIPFLEVKSLLYMNTPDSSFESNLIMHDNKAAIQIKIEGFHLLLPFDCESSLPKLITACQQINLKEHANLINSLDKLDALLQLKSPYIAAKSVPERKLTLIDKVGNDFSLPWERIIVEWILACEVQAKTASGSKLLEQLLPDLLFHYRDKSQCLRLIQSAENKDNTPEERRLYASMHLLLSNEDYSAFPIHMVWAMALTTTADSARCFDAYQLWNKHACTFNSKLKGLFTKLFVRKLSLTRPDLAAEILNGIPDSELLFADAAIAFTDIQTNYKSKLLFQTDKNQRVLISVAKKIHLSRSSTLEPPTHYLNAILWIIEALINKKDYAAALELAELIQAYPQFLELLKKALSGSWEEKAKELIPSNLENALTLLSLIQPSPAVEWKKLFEKMKALRNKNLSLKAWNIFYKFLEDPQGLQGTSYEIAEAWVWVLKTISEFHSKKLFDFFGKEKSLLAAFEDPSTHAIKEFALLNLYENLLRECEESCSEDNLKQLLKFRKELDHCAISAQWIIADQKLAKKLSSSCITLQMAAFNIYVRIGKGEEAEQIILSLLSSNIKGKETEIIASLLLFFSRLPKEKGSLALTILLIPSLNAVFACSPEESLETLLAWYEKMEAAQALTLALTLSILDGILDFISLPKDAQKVLPCVFKVINFLENCNSLPRKSNLKLLLTKNHDKIVQLLEIEDKWEDMFKLMSTFKRFSMNLPIDQASMDRYLKMFSVLIQNKDKKITEDLCVHYQWFQAFNKQMDFRMRFNNQLICFGFIDMLFLLNSEKAESLIPYFLTILSSHEGPSISANCRSVFIITCQSILDKAIFMKDQDLISNAWHLFWEFLSKNVIHRSPSSLARGWCSTLESVCKAYPGAHFHILNNIDDFRNFVEFFTDADSIKVMKWLLTSSSTHLCLFKDTDQKKYLQIWLLAKEKLKNSFSSETDIDRVTMRALILAGDALEYDKAYHELETEVSNLPVTVDSLLQMTHWFQILFSAPASERLSKILLNGIFKTFIGKVNNLLQQESNIPDDILNLFVLIFSERLSFEGRIQFLEDIWECPPCKLLLEFGVSVILNSLRLRIGLPEKHRNSLGNWLGKYLEKIDELQVVIPRGIFIETLKTPILDRKLIGNPDNASIIYQRLISINFRYLDKTDSLKEKHISDRKAFIGFCATYIPMIEGFSKNSYIAVFRCLGDLLINSPDFEATYNYFMKTMYHQNEDIGIDEQTRNKHRYDLEILFIKMLLEYKPKNPIVFAKISATLKSNFLNIITFAKSVDEEFLSLLHQYAFFTYNKNIDTLTKYAKNLTSSHYADLKAVLIELWKKKILKEPFRLFQYNCLLSSPKFKFDRMLPEEEEKAIKEVADIMLSESTYYGTFEMIRVLTSPHIGYCFSPSAYVYCWEKTFQIIAKMKPHTKNDFSFFEQALNVFLSTEQVPNPNTTSEWKESYAKICKTIFTELCKPDCMTYCQQPPPSIEVICNKASNFLITALKRELFDEDVYFDLLLRLMLKVLLEMRKGDDNLKSSLSQMILNLIRLKGLTAEVFFDLEKLWFSKLIDLNFK
jgi:hypothetical protein